MFRIGASMLSTAVILIFRLDFHGPIGDCVVLGFLQGVLHGKRAQDGGLDSRDWRLLMVQKRRENGGQGFQGTWGAVTFRKRGENGG
jgi:hypothetical protein